MQAVGTKNRTSLHSIDGSVLKTRGSLSIGRGGHVRKRRRGSLSFGISSYNKHPSICPQYPGIEWWQSELFVSKQRACQFNITKKVTHRRSLCHLHILCKDDNLALTIHAFFIILVSLRMPQQIPTLTEPGTETLTPKAIVVVLLYSSFLQCIQVITHHLFTIVDNSPSKGVLPYQ